MSDASITLTKKQAAKVEEFARNAKTLAGNVYEDDKSRYAAVLKLTNKLRTNGQKFTLTCVPGFAKPAIDAAMSAKPVATKPAKSGKSKPSTYTNDGKGKGWQARSANRAKRNGGTDPLATSATAKPMNSGKLTVETLASRVDSLDAKLDMILAKLAS